MSDDRRARAQEALAAIGRRVLGGEITEGEGLALAAKTKAPVATGGLPPRMAKLIDLTLRRVENIEAAGSAEPVARDDKPKSPLAAVWNSMETMARRLIAAEKGQAELLELLADQEARIAALEAERRGQA